MDGLISLVQSAGTKALESWGAWAICLLLLGALCWALWSRLGELEKVTQTERSSATAELEKLRSEVARLQELRITDAQRMTEVVRNGTATMADRTQGDGRLQELILTLVTGMARKGLVEIPPMLEASPQALRSP